MFLIQAHDCMKMNENLLVGEDKKKPLVSGC
jgi:hypothetical protein